MSYWNHHTVPFVKHISLSLLFLLSLQSRNSGAWLMLGELLPARRDCSSLFSKSIHLGVCQGLFQTCQPVVTGFKVLSCL